MKRNYSRRFWLRSIAQFSAIAFAVFTCAVFSPAQEIPLSAIPPAMRKPIPEHVAYRMFLRHAAAMEREARSNEAQARSGEAYRNHIVHKFGVTAEEQSKIAEIALGFDQDLSALRAQEKQILDAFEAKYFPNHRYPKGIPLPTSPAELIPLEDQVKTRTLQARDQIHAALGDERFSHLDSMVKFRTAHPDPVPAVAPR